VGVVFDPKHNHVVSAWWAHDDRPVGGFNLRILRSAVEQTVELIGWRRYKRRFPGGVRKN
jgi:hypothetical protein